MTIDHFGFGVSDYERSKTFYSTALAPLGIVLQMEVEQPRPGPKILACGFGKPGRPDFWMGGEGRTTPPIHLAFVVDTRTEVRAFHEAALRAGGRDNGAPGVRPQYHPSYYAAFVLDPDGHNIEAVCHAPE